jgi:hypothetical protein
LEHYFAYAVGGRCEPGEISISKGAFWEILDYTGLLKHTVIPRQSQLVATLVLKIQGDQKVSGHLMITVQKTRKNVLNSFSHLP